jgi:hypothetical protein
MELSSIAEPPGSRQWYDEYPYKVPPGGGSSNISHLAFRFTLSSRLRVEAAAPRRRDEPLNPLVPLRSKRPVPNLYSFFLVTIRESA